MQPIVTLRSFVPALILLGLVSCGGADQPSRKGAQTATGLLRSREGSVLLSDCKGDLKRLVGELPAELRALADSVAADPGMIVWLELDGNDLEIRPEQDASIPGMPFEALGILLRSDSMPCPALWHGTYYHRSSSSVQGKSMGKLGLQEDGSFMMSLTDPGTGMPTTFEGRWLEEGPIILLMSDSMKFEFRKTGLRTLTSTSSVFGERLEMERN